MIWKPDTCKCIVTYVAGNHSTGFISAVKCALHIDVPDSEISDVILQESMTVQLAREVGYQEHCKKILTPEEIDKAKFIFEILGIQKEAPTEVWEYGKNVVCTFNPDRTLNVEIMGKTLSSTEKTDMETKLKETLAPILATAESEGSLIKAKDLSKDKTFNIK